MKIKVLILIASFGILMGLVSVLFYNETSEHRPPVAVSYNPYKNGIYATGIVESFQPTGSNINIYPEVADRVTHVFVKDGQVVKKNTPILAIDNSVQKETTAKDFANIQLAHANLINVLEQLQKIKKAYTLNPQAVSKNALDNAINSVKIAQATLRVNTKQYDADRNLLAKYILRAPINGIILRVVPAVGDYVSPRGSYDTYTQDMLPSVQMGFDTPYLQVRAYVDEILTPRLPNPSHLKATLFVRGLDNRKIPLEFVQLQPYTIPNIELSDQRNERVDVRVLPIIFKFKKPTDINLFPGQMVDVYLKGTA